jgi:hypothetical protein
VIEMNERIRELADEARIKFSAHWAHQGVDTAVITRLDLKEFAELIVRECMTMSDELKAQYLTSRKSTMDFDEKNIYAEGEAACDIIKYKMKKQFGVEE